MANVANHKWEGSTLKYNIPGAGDAALDVSQLNDDVKQAAMLFGIQTAARNATAGLFKEDPTAALKRMNARFEAWLKGVWKAASTGEGERPTSLLAMAVAEAGGITADEAAQIISDLIESKAVEAGLSADEEDDKPAIRKIGAAVRASFAELPEVAVPYARLKAEEANKRAAKAAADAEAARTKPVDPNAAPTASLKDLLKK
jgi:hypothetical protein